MDAKLSDLVKTTTQPSTSTHPLIHGTPTLAWHPMEEAGVPRQPDHKLSPPAGFDLRCITIRNAAYQCWQDGRTSALAGGVLSSAEVIWVSANSPERRSQRNMLAFSERIGMILIDAHTLRRHPADRSDNTGSH